MSIILRQHRNYKITIYKAIIHREISMQFYDQNMNLNSLSYIDSFTSCKKRLGANTVNKENKIWKAAMYLRLSKDDGQLESSSISNQRDLISDFLENEENITIYNERIDDGISGVSFDRPSFNAMMDDIRDGIIDCIIVKDISRFGRNYIEVGKYLQQLFPFMRVRFISVNDDYDSADPKKSGNFITSFRAIVDEFYSHDLSIKIKSSMEKKAKSGQYINAFTPYGYLKSSFNRHLLEIDIETVDIVRGIFHEFTNGKSKCQIARELNVKGILTPSMHKAKNGIKLHSAARQKDNFWTDQRVHKILTDERYIGSTVYGKTKRETMGQDRCIKINKEDWVVAPNMHEGIITGELFYNVQSKTKESKRTSANKKNMFHSLIICGICDHSLLYSQSSSIPYFYCNTKRFTEKFSCKNTKILLSDIKKSVSLSIKLQAEFANKAEILLNSNALSNKKELKLIQDKFTHIEKAIKICVNHSKKIFESKIDGLITEEVCTSERALCTQERTLLESNLEDLKLKTDLLKGEIEYDRTVIGKYKTYQFIDFADDNLIISLVDKILIFDSHTLDIKWKYQSEIQKLKCIYDSIIEEK